MSVTLKLKIGETLSKMNRSICNDNKPTIVEMYKSKMDSTRFYELVSGKIPVNFMKYNGVKTIIPLIRKCRIITDDILPISYNTINIWHGPPGKMTGLVHPKKIKDLYLYMNKFTGKFITTSDFFKEKYQKQFGIDDDKFIKTTTVRIIDSQNQQKDIRKLVFIPDYYDKVAIYLPTYRYNSYDKDTNTMINVIKRFIEDVSNLKHVFFVLKPHPSIEEKIYPLIRDTSNVVILSSKRLELSRLWLYNILGSFDYIITDYSSVLLESVLYNKPVIRYVPDYKQLQKRTGFLVEEEYLPGEMTKQLTPDNFTNVDTTNYKELRKLYYEDNIKKNIVHMMRDIGLL